jgi:hypothetical protein
MRTRNLRVEVSLKSRVAAGLTGVLTDNLNLKLISALASVFCPPLMVGLDYRLAATF